MTEVMTLGRTMLSAAKPDTPAVDTDWAFVLGSYAGAWLAGAGVGYVVGRSSKSAQLGGLAASGIWGVGETLGHARNRNWLLTTASLAVGATSLYFAWTRKTPW